MTGKEMMAANDSRVTGDVLASLITRGDISGLGAEQKAAYYTQLCTRVGLDPATAPFQPLKLNGKEILYATKGAAEQLRNLHKISVTIVDRQRLEDVYFVTARASTPDGRSDESQGAVSIAGLKGEQLANAIMKAETKAKRRVTLSIVGLGMLDESELDTIPSDRFASLPPERAQIVQAANEEKPKALPPKATLPALPDRIDTIPAEITKVFAALDGLAGVPLLEMSQDDLELVMSVAHDNRPKVKTQLAKQWLASIEARAIEVLDERNGAGLGEVAP